jgi:hypothetical protein
MSITVTCPNGHSLQAKEKHAGKTVQCPKCRAPVSVPLDGLEVVDELETTDELETIDELHTLAEDGFGFGGDEELGTLDDLGNFDLGSEIVQQPLPSLKQPAIPAQADSAPTTGDSEFAQTRLRLGLLIGGAAGLLFLLLCGGVGAFLLLLGGNETVVTENTTQVEPIDDQNAEPAREDDARQAAATPEANTSPRLDDLEMPSAQNNLASDDEASDVPPALTSSGQVSPKALDAEEEPTNASRPVTAELEREIQATSEAVSGTTPRAVVEAEVSSEVFDLGGTAIEAVLAARGRMVVLRIAETESLAIFDLVAGKILKQIPRGGEKWRVAAGQDILICVNRETAEAEQWSLESLEPNGKGKLDMPTPIGVIAMGCGSGGPLLVTPGQGGRGGPTMLRGAHEQIRFFDPTTLKIAYDEISRQGRMGIPAVSWQEVQNITASTDGRTFAFAKGQCVLRIAAGGVSARYVDLFRHDGVTLYPGPAGEYIYGLHLPMDANMRMIPTKKQEFWVGEHTIPDVDGPFYLQMPKCQVALAGTDAPLATLALTKPKAANVDGRYLPAVAHLVSGARLAFTLVEANQKLERVPFDPEHALQQIDEQFVTVLSRPETTVKAETEFRYQLRPVTNDGTTTCSLEFGPPGMTVSALGLVAWNVPNRLRDIHPGVAIRVTATGGRTAFHRFSLHVSSATVEANAKPVASIAVADAKAADPMELKPISLGQPRHEVDLPATVDDTIVGGGGRFLLLKMNSIGKVAVFDVTRAEVIGYLPLPKASALVTAGANCVIVIDHDQVHRWNLADLSFDRTAELALPARPVDPTARLRRNEPADDRQQPQKLSPLFAHMGSATEGPIVIGFPRTRWVEQQPLTFLNGNTLEPLAIRVEWDKVVTRIGMTFTRISATGNVLTGWSSSSPTGVQLLVDTGAKFESRYIHQSFGSLLPTPDGRYILGEGAITNRIRPAGFKRLGLSIPAVRGPYYLFIERTKDPEDAMLRQMVALDEKGERKPIAVCAVGDGRALARLTSLDPLSETAGGIEDTSSLDVDKRIWLVPAAKTVIQMPPRADRLILHEFDIDKALDEVPFPYLYYESSPPLTIRTGTEWSYQTKLKSKNGETTLRLPIAPKGMALGDDGILTWQPSRSDTNKSHQVTIIATDSQGEEAQQTFHVSVY